MTGCGVTPTRVLVVDDEPQIRRALAINLRARGYEVDLAEDGRTALELAARSHPDVVVLDLGLPELDGVEVIHGLRGWSRVPIVVLSVRDAERDKVAALDAGADDYVTKPFGMDELLARLRAALRRAAPAEEAATVETPDFVIDLAAKRVVRDGTEVRLTPTEWHLVEVLVRNRGRLVTQRQLLQEVWGPEYGEETNYLRVYMAQVRRKLEPEPSQPALLHHRARHGLPLRASVTEKPEVGHSGSRSAWSSAASAVASASVGTSIRARFARRHSRKGGMNDTTMISATSGSRYLSTLSPIGRAERVAEHRDADGPEQRADHVVESERAAAHRADARHHGRERAHDRHEAGEHDGLRAVTVEERLGALDVLLFEQARVRAAEEPGPEPVADRVADLGPDDRGDEAADDDERDVEVALRCEQPGGEQQRVAGEEEADQQPGLGEDDQPEPDLAVGAQRVDDVLGIEAEAEDHRGRLDAAPTRSACSARFPQRFWGVVLTAGRPAWHHLAPGCAAGGGHGARLARLFCSSPGQTESEDDFQHVSKAQ